MLLKIWYQTEQLRAGEEFEEEDMMDDVEVEGFC